MTTRLNDALREKIYANALMASGLPKVRKVLNSDRADLADRIRVELLGGAKKAKSDEAKAKRLIANIKAFKESSDLLHNADYIYVYARQDLNVNLAGYSVRIYFKDKKGQAVKRVCPDTSGKPALPASNPLCDEFLAIEGRQEDLDKGQAAFRAKVWSTLKAVNTTKQLLDGWPEAVKLIPEEVKQSKTTLPALRREELNTLVGLGGEK